MKRDYPAWAMLMFILALTLALPPVPAHSETMSVSLCGGGTRVIRLTPDPANPGEQDKSKCCDKACHTGNDRRKRAEGLAPVCC